MQVGTPATAGSLNEPGGATAAGAPGAAGAAPSAQGSFLDEWLAKRQDKGLTRSPGPAPGAPSNPAPTTTKPAATEPVPAEDQRATAPTLAEIKKDKHDRLPDRPKKSEAKHEEPKPVAKTVKVHPPKAPESTKNISSDEIERTEVHMIAEELKSQLDSPEHIAEEKIRHMKVQSKPVEEGPSPEDTIYIDREGNIKNAADAAKQSAEVKIDNSGKPADTKPEDSKAQ